MNFFSLVLNNNCPVKEKNKTKQNLFKKCFYTGMSLKCNQSFFSLSNKYIIHIHIHIQIFISISYLVYREVEKI